MIFETRIRWKLDRNWQSLRMKTTIKKTIYPILRYSRKSGRTSYTGKTFAPMFTLVILFRFRKRDKWVADRKCLHSSLFVSSLARLFCLATLECSDIAKYQSLIWYLYQMEISIYFVWVMYRVIRAAYKEEILATLYGFDILLGQFFTDINTINFFSSITKLSRMQF